MCDVLDGVVLAFLSVLVISHIDSTGRTLCCPFFFFFFFLFTFHTPGHGVVRPFLILFMVIEALCFMLPFLKLNLSHSQELERSLPRRHAGTRNWEAS